MVLKDRFHGGHSSNSLIRFGSQIIDQILMNLGLRLN